MEEITKAAKAVYANFSDKEKKDLEGLFKEMDKNGDGKISLQEFIASSKTKRAWFSNLMANRSYFNLVDQNGDGTLQFEELLTLCYLRASPRPWCDGCGVFIGGLFFTCTHCLLTNKANGNSYDLCIPCYHGRQFVHEHTEFVDNYMLIAKMLHMLSSGAHGAQTISSQSSDGSKHMKEKVKRVFRKFAETLSLADDAIANELEDLSSPDSP